MARKGDQPTQKTNPKKGKPVDIPVPKRGDILRDLKRAAQSPPQSSPRSR